jgi:hypothetical protein
VSATLARLPGLGCSVNHDGTQMRVFRVTPAPPLESLYETGQNWQDHLASFTYASESDERFEFCDRGHAMVSQSKPVLGLPLLLVRRANGTERSPKLTSSKRPL